jgi:acetyl-CoA carboxylase carboxyl transferase subunit alpha
MQSLDFEKPIAELEDKIRELRHLSQSGGLSIADEVGKLEQRLEKTLRQTYGRLAAEQKVQVARHPARPRGRDYIAGLISDFEPLSGDRHFAEDHAILGGLGRFKSRSVVVIAQEKGHDTESRLKHNFGMARPEGYRKAQRLMRLAERFELPILTFVDTPGAYPGVGAEERGQSEAIARSIETCLDVSVPLIATVIGEGGSGGAVALAAADRVFMLEHAVYSVISPEGCASILWRDAAKAKDAAAALKLTAQDLSQLEVIDGIIEEPLGGAHRDPQAAIANAGKTIAHALERLRQSSGPELRRRRRDRYLTMGAV